MTSRAGFTLLELMVAIVVTGVVALLAYGTAAAGFDTRDRLERHRTSAEAQMIVREIVLDALRHPPEGGGAAMNDVLFTIDDRTGADGLPIDGLAFLSRGIVPPLGASGTWSVTLVPAEDGLRLRAVPEAATDATPIETRLEGVRGMSVRVLARTGDTGWSERWDAPGRVPAAVAIRFLDARGAAVGPPLVVNAALEPVR